MTKAFLVIYSSSGDPITLSGGNTVLNVHARGWEIAADGTVNPDYADVSTPLIHSDGTASIYERLADAYRNARDDQDIMVVIPGASARF